VHGAPVEARHVVRAHARNQPPHAEPGAQRMGAAVARTAQSRMAGPSRRPAG
jgi:hypothetical protein